MIKCVIIDDEEPAINILKQYIERVPFLELAGTETNPLLGIELIKNERPDVVFLDIQMDEMNGIEVARVLDDCKVVFCTAYSEFAVTSYEVNAVDYLMKPIEFNRFVKAVNRLNNVIDHRTQFTNEAIANDYFYVKMGIKGKMLKIEVDDIDYVEARSNYVAIYRGQEMTLVYLSMKELEERLPGSQFMRVHKSYIVSLKQISLLENNELVLKKKITKRIPVGANYKAAFLERMKDKLMS